MRCPFLQEAQVKSCRRAAVRKMIPWAPGDGQEKCRSAAFSHCAVFRERPDPGASGGICPLLDEALVQYCSASPVRKFVPYSESSLCRCGRDGFRYCDAYLSLASPADPCAAVAPSGGREYRVDDLRVPDWLWYSGNHMWLDINAEEDSCHVGIDAFAARLLSPIERVSFITVKGLSRPGAVITTRGVDLQVVFPDPVRITAPNLYLRADPSRLAAAPYTHGWLFEGEPPRALQSEPDLAIRNGLVTGAEAAAWMREEVRRLPALPGTGRPGRTAETVPRIFLALASWKGQL